VRLTADARNAWEALTDTLARELNREDLSDAVKGHVSKLRSYAARLSLIIHCLRLVTGEVKDENVDATSVDRAGHLVGYFGGHAKKVHCVLGSDTRIADAGKLLDWVRQQGERFTRRDAYRAMRGRVNNVDDLTPLLALLEKHGFIKPVETSRSGPGRKPTEMYLVNPLDNGLNGLNGQNSAAPPNAKADASDSVHSVHSVHCPDNSNQDGDGHGDAYEGEPESPFADFERRVESFTPKLSAHQWLSAPLLAGPRTIRDILQEGQQRGYSEKYVRRLAEECRLVQVDVDGAPGWRLRHAGETA
jgi:hypothetical protein